MQCGFLKQCVNWILNYSVWEDRVITCKCSITVSTLDFHSKDDGSIPFTYSDYYLFLHVAGMVELADTSDLSSDVH